MKNNNITSLSDFVNAADEAVKSQHDTTIGGLMNVMIMDLYDYFNEVTDGTIATGIAHVAENLKQRVLEDKVGCNPIFVDRAKSAMLNALIPRQDAA